MNGTRVVWPAKGEVALEKFSIGEPKADELLVKTSKTLISPGTERAWLMNFPNTPNKYPQYPGYSNSGIVIKAGRNAKGFKAGDRVASGTSHASHVITPAAKALKLPRNVSDAEACFFSLGSVAMQGVRKSNIELGDSVVIIGQGIVGLMATQLAKLSGALPLIAVDVYDDRLRLSKKYGADYALNSKKCSLEEKVRELTGGKGAKVVIEATGNSQVIAQSFRLASEFGRIILVGSPRGESMINFYNEIHCNGISIIGAHAGTRPEVDSFHNYWARKEDNKFVIELLKWGRISMKEMINFKTNYRKAPDAYKKIINMQSDILGIIIDWSAGK